MVTIYGITRYEYIDLCDILGADWCKVSDYEDDLVDVSLNMELVQFKYNGDSILFDKGKRYAGLDNGHFVRVEIL